MTGTMTDTPAMEDARLPVEQVRTLSNVRAELGDIDDLVDSMQSEGLINPIVVRPDGDGWAVIAGHRRLAAAAQLGWAEIDARIWQGDLNDVVAFQLAENLARRDLSMAEEADAVMALVSEHAYTVEAVAKAAGRGVEWVRRRLTFAGLPAEFREVAESDGWTWEQVSQVADALESTLTEPDQRQAALLQAREAGFNSSAHVLRVADRVERDRVIDEIRERAERKGVQLVVRDSYDWPKKWARLADLPGVDPKAHDAEECAALLVDVYYVDGTPKAERLCTDRKRHNARGKSALKVEGSEREQAEREARAEERRQEAEARRIAAQRRRDRVHAMKRSEADRLALLAMVFDAHQMEAKEVVDTLGLDREGHEDDSAVIEAEAGSSRAALSRVAVMLGYVKARQQAWRLPEDAPLREVVSALDDEQ